MALSPPPPALLLLPTRLFSVFALPTTPQPALPSSAFDSVPADVLALALDSLVQDEDDDTLCVLCLGEGNFHFAAKLVSLLETEFAAYADSAHQSKRFHVFATELRPRYSLLLEYKDSFLENEAFLLDSRFAKNGSSPVLVECRFQVDACTLQPQQQRGKEEGFPLCDLISFNFCENASPFVGVDQAYVLDHELVKGFFSNARHMLKPGGLVLMATQELAAGNLIMRRNSGISLNWSSYPRQYGFIPRWTRPFLTHPLLRFYQPVSTNADLVFDSNACVWWLFSMGTRAITVPGPHSEILVLKQDARPIRNVVLGDFYEFGQDCGDFGNRNGNLDPPPMRRLWDTLYAGVEPPSVFLFDHFAPLEAYLDYPEDDPEMEIRFLRLFTMFFFEASLSRWPDHVAYFEPDVSLTSGDSWLHRACSKFNAVHQARGGKGGLAL